MSQQKIAKQVGWLYLLIAIIAPFSMIIIPSKLMVAGDASVTVKNILASQTLFHLGLVSDTLVFLIEIILVVLIYVLFKPISKIASLIAAYARLAMTIIQGINLLNYILVIMLLSGAGYLAVFKQEQLHALVMVCLNAHQYVESIWGAFFGLHCLVLGYLLYKSKYFPQVVGMVLGVLLVFGGVGYLLDSLGSYLLPNHQTMATITWIFLGPGTIGELILTFWLIIKGVKTATFMSLAE